MSNDNFEFRTITCGDFYLVEFPCGQNQELLFNGKEPAKPYGEAYNWYLVDANAKVQRKVREERTQIGFILSDQSLASEKIPLRLPMEVESKKWSDVLEEDVYSWSPEWASLKSLYTGEYNITPSKLVDVEVKYNIIGSIDKLPARIKPIKAHSGGFGGNAYAIESRHLTRPLEAKILIPAPMMPSMPCTLDSKQMYDIVRSYVKDFCDRSIVTITSDYDFCFTVKKSVKLAKPYDRKSTSNVGTKRKPHFPMVSVTTKEETVFEMTYSPANYKGYTPIAPLSASSEVELEEKLDAYLKEVIAIINAPAKECECCGGSGIITEKVKLTTNENKPK